MKKILIPLVVVLVTLVGWVVGLGAVQPGDNSAEIAQYLSVAEQQMRLEAYGAAVACYERVIGLEDTLAHNQLLAEAYRRMGRSKQYQDVLEEIVFKFPREAAGYETLANHYYEVERYTDCVTTVTDAAKAGVRTDRLTQLYLWCAYRYTLVGESYEEAHCFSGPYAVVRVKGKFRYLNESLAPAMPQLFFDAASDFTATGGVTVEGDSYFIDEEGLKYLASDEPYERLWAMSENRAAAVKDGRYVYVNSVFQPVLGPYDQATSFADGVAAVRSGDQWTLIDAAGTQIGGPYQDVKIDEYNYCSRQGRIFVKTDDWYILVDSSGKRMGQAWFEDAEPFFTDTWAAVKQDGRWGFVDGDGAIVIEPSEAYEEARSFGGGLAAVKIEGGWSFISKADNVVINSMFMDAKCFSDNGLCPVKIGGAWRYIKLTSRP
ncbi:MAG: WG repeat-containing protein [Oscillospiraceae bacterium]|nr:WG repeat-containing protein [Oscillospiraceae bacterium]